MLEYKLNNDETIKYKKGLSEAEYLTVIEFAIDAYKDGIGGQQDLFGVVPYNPVKAQQAFYRALCEVCIEDYDSARYAEYFEAGIPVILVMEVSNAAEAWDTVQSIIDNSMSMSVTINKFLSGVLSMLDEKLSEGVDMAKVLKKFPKDLSKALADYTEVMSPSKAEFDEKVENGDFAKLEKQEEQK